MKDSELRPFQRTFIKKALARDTVIGALSMARSSGKSALCAHIARRALTPSDPLYQRGKEVVVYSASLLQSRFVYKFVRAELEPMGLGFSWANSTTAVGAKRRDTGDELRCLSSNPKTSLGMVNVSLVILDECSALEVTAGEALWDSISTAIGKPGSAMHVLLIGTRAPARGGWWIDLLDGGSHPGTYIQEIKGDLEKWDQWNEVLRCNPLASISPEFRKRLRQELWEARRDERKKSRFLSFRLNLESQDTTTMLLSVPEWRKCEERELGLEDGEPIVGIDLAGGRSWSAATAVHSSGRVDAFALTSGLPDIAAQERRDVVPKGAYQKLVDEGSLLVDLDRHIPRVDLLVAEVLKRWPSVSIAICDRFRLPELLDAFGGRVRVIPRVTRWSEASSDIFETRKMALDGNMSIDPRSRALMRIAMQSAIVENDTSGNSRLTKRSTNSSERDDNVSALVLACGLLARLPAPQPFEMLVGHRA